MFHFLIVVGTNQHVNHKVLKAFIFQCAASIQCHLQLFLGLVDGVVDCLVCLGSLKGHLFVDEVFNHVQIELNFKCFETFLTNMSLTDLFRKNLTTYKVSSHQNQLHLVQNEVNFFTDFEAAISFNLNLLNDLGCFLSFSIFFKELAELLCRLRILSFQKHLAFTCFSQSFKEFVLFLSARQLVEESVLTQLNHINDWFLGLSSSFAQNEQELSHLGKLVVVECKLDYSRADLCKLDVVRDLTSCLFFDHQIINLFQKVSPHFVWTDFYKALLANLRLCFIK